ncbi:hypothetical protein [Chlamydia suis]|uniref:hypothetical protein n=1 Tax=Chlamydia suis TaxID=83559 RepID=UPI0009B02574|nr:hypothetical protein [Chlamydia suis]
MKKLLPWIPHLLIPSVMTVIPEEAVLVLEEAHLLLLRQDQEEALAPHYRCRLFTKSKAQDPGYKEKDDAAVHQEEHIKQHSEFSQDRYQVLRNQDRNHQRFPFLTIERCKVSEALIRAANLLVRWVLQNYI